MENLDEFLVPRNARRRILSGRYWRDVSVSMVELIGGVVRLGVGGVDLGLDHLIWR